MNCNDNIFGKALENGLKDRGFYHKHGANNIYSIASNNKPDRITTAKLIGSEPIIEKLHGSKNNTEIKAIGYFKFKLSPEGNDPNFYIFAFSNNPDKKVEFVIVPCNELKNRITSRKCNTDKDQETELQLWLLPPYIFETTHFGGEGEWWFLAGRMAKNTIWDYTSFLNGWNRIITCT
jgi:hypothetical protein